MLNGPMFQNLTTANSFARSVNFAEHVSATEAAQNGTLTNMLAAAARKGLAKQFFSETLCRNGLAAGDAS
jgi:hypothetical protein